MNICRIHHEHGSTQEDSAKKQKSYDKLITKYNESVQAKDT